jgi:hypothetical protein
MNHAKIYVSAIIKHIFKLPMKIEIQRSWKPGIIFRCTHIEDHFFPLKFKPIIEWLVKTIEAYFDRLSTDQGVMLCGH